MISCLRAAGVHVDEHHVSVWEEDEHKWQAGAGAGARVVAAQAKLLRGPRPDFDVLVVGYPGQLDMATARLVARRRPIVFNPLVSLWDTWVADRGRFSPGSAAARLLARVDRAAFRAARRVVADTQEHADFFAGLAGLPRERFDVCLVGAEERVFHPPWEPGERFLFVGKLIPLHGLDTIIAAARIAPEVQITIAGRGQLEPLLRDRPANVEWVPWIDYEQLGGAYRATLCALGIFGTSDKASRVIPNKVFQALACGTPVITADTPAARELLADGDSALLVPPGDPEALAAALRQAAADPDGLRRIGEGGRRTYEEHASERVLGQAWRRVVEDVA